MRKKTTTGDEVQQTVRIPKEIHDWVASKAEKERRSINAQIIRLLECTMSQDECEAAAPNN